MSALALTLQNQRERLGLKGPRAAEWLVAHGIVLPMSPNTWTHPDENIAADGLLVARLGTAEFFLEDSTAGTTLPRISPSLEEHSRGGPPPGVYPVLREDWAFQLGGDGVHDVLVQVCNIDFAALPLAARPLIMTLMIGVAVLVVPQGEAGAEGAASERRYRIWCDPTFGPYLSESLGAVVIECGGRYTGVSE
jgi:sarcosine oxidase, subunit gamma